MFHSDGFERISREFSVFSDLEAVVVASFECYGTYEYYLLL